MKKIIYIGGISLILGVMSVYWFSKNNNIPEASKKIEKSESIQEHTKPQGSQSDSEPLPQITFDDKEEAEAFNQLTEEQQRNPQILAYIKAFRTPISFYGKVVDIEGNPVSDAEILFSAVNRPLSPNNLSTQYTGLSDHNGMFSITDIRGTRLTVRVSKAGYHTLPNEMSSLRYATPSSNSVFPTKDNPVVFILEKLNEPVDLYKDRKKQKLSLTGTPATVSIFNGKGLLRISLRSDYNPTDNSFSNWDAVITLSNGGFIETEDIYNFEAPEEGYISEIEYRVTEDMERKPQRMDRTFYFNLNNGEYYGRMELLISAVGGYRIEYYINPYGDRNLNSR